MMGLSLGLSLGGQGGAADIAAPTIDTAGSVAPGTWQAGTEETLTRGTASAAGGGAITYELEILIDGMVAASGTGATLAYTPQGADVSDSYAARWRATETGGTSDGTTLWQTVATGTVAGVAPSVTASDSLATRTLTITVDTLDGEPTPDTDLTTLTLDGADVLVDATGEGPWSYVVPDSAASQTVAWTVTASNGVSPEATASGSEVVAANLSAPVATGGLADLTLTVDEAMTPVDVSADFDLGNPEATIALQSGTLPAGLSFDGTTLSGTPTTVAGAVSLVFRATNSVGSDDSGFQVTVQEASALPTNVIFIGASLVKGFAGGDNTNNVPETSTEITNAVRALADSTEYDGITVRGYGTPALALTSHNTSDPDFANGLADAIDDVLAVYPDDGTNWYIFHIGGTDVTSGGYRPAETMGPGEVSEWNANLATAMTAITSNIDQTRAWVMTTTFRDYGLDDSCFRNELLGSAPFNDGIEASGGTVTGIIEYLAANMPNSMASYGRTVFDPYREVKRQYEIILDPNDGGDASHPGATGNSILQAYIAAGLNYLFRGQEPPEVVDRVYTLQTTLEADGSISITYDGGNGTVIDSITFEDPDSVEYWEGTHETYADGSPLDLTVTNTLAAKCIVAPPVTVTNDADASGTPSLGDTLAIPDMGVWLDGGNDVTLTVVWHDAEGVIPGATGLNYTVGEDQTGEGVFPVITATAPGRTSESQSCAVTQIDSGAWQYSGDEVSNIPSDENWVFSGDAITTIPTGV